MRKKILVLRISCFILATMFLTSSIMAEENKQAGRDRRIFERLLTQRNEAYQKYLGVLEEGKKELKEKGEISLELQDKILRQRSEKDRIETKLISIALRHGWEIPELPENGIKLEGSSSPELNKVFSPAQALVKSELRKEAVQFIANVELPLQKIDLKKKK